MAITRNSKDQTFDLALRLKDAGLIAATAACQVGGANKILDVGAARVDMRALIDITAIEIDTGNELYTIMLQGSTSVTFASGIFNLGSLLVGHSSTCLETVSTVASMREIAFCNEANGVAYQYIRAYIVVAGTVATGINCTINAFVKA